MKLNPAFEGKAKVIPEGRDKLFLPYQKRWIMDNTTLKLIEKSRQIGLSWSTAYRLVRQCALKGNTLDTWVSSRDDIQARLFLDDCKNFAGFLHKSFKDLGEQVYQDDKGKPYTSYEISFANRRKIHSMSSNADAQAGKRGTRVLDEFALHPDPRKLYAIASPGITWGGQMEMISTHRGSQNFFNLLVNEIKEGGNPKKVSLHTVTLQDALDQGFLFKLQQKLLKAGAKGDERIQMDEAEYFDHIKNQAADDETFDQEYMCKPSDDKTAFLSYDEIAACQYARHENWEIDLLDIKNPLYIGFDVARVKDLSVIWVLEKAADRYYTRRITVFKNTKFSIQEAALYRLLRLPQVRRCCIDQSGLGRNLADNAKEKFAAKVEGVNFTQASKEELAHGLKSTFEDLAVRIPVDPEGKIVADLRAIKKETTAAGNVRFSADRSEDGHSDRFWALALAVHAGKNPQEFGKGSRADQSRFGRSAERRDRSVISRAWGGLRGIGRSIIG